MYKQTAKNIDDMVWPTHFVSLMFTHTHTDSDHHLQQYTLYKSYKFYKFHFCESDVN